MSMDASLPKHLTPQKGLKFHIWSVCDDNDWQLEYPLNQEDLSGAPVRSYLAIQADEPSAVQQLERNSYLPNAPSCRRCTILSDEQSQSRVQPARSTVQSASTDFPAIVFCIAQFLA